MSFLVENWYLFLVIVVVAVVIGMAVGRFLKLPTKEQVAKVKEWLLYACTEAEAELGSGTGQLKLRYVYDLFVTRFPAVARVVSFDTFSLWVDGALEEMRGMLANNKAIREVVNKE